MHQKNAFCLKYFKGLSTARMRANKDQPKTLTLARFKAWVCLVNHVYTTFAANNAAVAVSCL